MNHHVHRPGRRARATPAIVPSSVASSEESTATWSDTTTAPRTAGRSSRARKEPNPKWSQAMRSRPSLNE